MSATAADSLLCLLLNGYRPTGDRSPSSACSPALSIDRLRSASPSPVARSASPLHPCQTAALALLLRYCTSHSRSPLHALTHAECRACSALTRGFAPSYLLAPCHVSPCRRGVYPIRPRACRFGSDHPSRRGEVSIPLAGSLSSDCVWLVPLRSCNRTSAFQVTPRPDAPALVTSEIDTGSMDNESAHARGRTTSWVRRSTCR